ncbi:MAG: hypothetical protein GF311_03175 [Candidatus Lokiarchaeota archaeon]|nr:hypothetical protein [Candidatus Lokiarchaeota archaeon]
MSSEKYDIIEFLTADEIENKNAMKKQNFNSLKIHGNKIYTGMRVGGKHYWKYNGGRWYEVKKAPDEWKITFNCIKKRYNEAPNNSGAARGTKYHWYIIADQIAEKLDANSYLTTMRGFKYKIGHQRPHWRNFSYDYPEQQSYTQKVIEVLERTISQLKANML